MAAIEDVYRQDDSYAADDCRTIVLTYGQRSRRATIFFHGMSSAPRQFAELAAYAHRSGDNVLVPRLPWHGCRDRASSELGRLRGDDLVACAEKSLAIAHGLGEKVRVVGFSLGGLLAVWVAKHHVISQVIAIAPMLGVWGIPYSLTRTFASALRRLPNLLIWWDIVRREDLMPRHGYPKFSTHGVAEALIMADDLLEIANRNSPRSPVVFVINDGETAVNNWTIRHLVEIWSGKSGIVQHYRIEGIGPSHDIIEPLRDSSHIDKSYPLLHRLLDG